MEKFQLLFLYLKMLELDDFIANDPIMNKLNSINAMVGYENIFQIILYTCTCNREGFIASFDKICSQIKHIGSCLFLGFSINP